MDHLFKQLCESLEEELERHETMGAVCSSQEMAARAFDTEHLEARTAAMGVLIRDIARGVQERQPLLAQIVNHYELPAERQTLTGLVESASDPWKTRLGELQGRMQRHLGEIQQTVRRSAMFMRRSLKTIEHSMESLSHGVVAPTEGYRCDGSDRSRPERAAVLVDQRG